MREWKEGREEERKGGREEKHCKSPGCLLTGHCRRQNTCRRCWGDLSSGKDQSLSRNSWGRNWHMKVLGPAAWLLECKPSSNCPGQDPLISAPRVQLECTSCFIYLFIYLFIFATTSLALLLFIALIST